MWQRLNEKELDNIGGPYALLFRAYGWEGKLWPRCVISIYPDIFNGNPDENLKITCNVKKSEPGWWTEQGIPRSLLTDTKEMLDEVVSIPYKVS